MSKSVFELIKDEKYGYYKIHPTPSDEVLNQFYNSLFYSERLTFNDSALAVQLEEKEFNDYRWQRVVNVCKDYFNNKFNIFDVGFGFAQSLLYYNSKNIEVGGIEPSEVGVNYAKSMGLTNVFLSGVEDFNIELSDKYDVVTLMNVLEHLRNPVKTINKIKSELLNDGGLIIIDVPNEFNDFQTVANEEYDLKEWWLCPPSHLNYFSTDSLCNLLVDNGFEIVKKENSFPLELFLLMGKDYINNPELGKEIHNSRVLFETLMHKHGKSDKLYSFYESLAELNLGRQTIVYAKKIC